MAKLTLTDLGTTLANTAATVLNNNDALIEVAFENTLSRDGTGPNQMEADFDLNNNDLLNANAINTQELYIDGERVVPADAVNAGNFATAAQGAKADTALQPADIGSTVQAFNADLLPFALAAVHVVDDRTTLRAVDTTKKTVVFLKEAGREGLFKWTAGNYSSHVTADTAEGIFIAADAVSSTAGAWVRVYDEVDVRWFGAVGDGSNATAAFLDAISLSQFLGLNRIVCRDASKEFLIVELQITDDIEIDLYGGTLLGDFDDWGLSSVDSTPIYWTKNVFFSEEADAPSITLKRMLLNGQSDPAFQMAGGTPIIDFRGAAAVGDTKIVLEDFTLTRGSNRIYTTGSGITAPTEALDYRNAEVLIYNADEVHIKNVGLRSSPGEMLQIQADDARTRVYIDKLNATKARDSNPATKWSSSALNVLNCHAASYMRDSFFYFFTKGPVNWQLDGGIIENCHFVYVDDSNGLDFNEAGAYRFNNHIVRNCFFKDIVNVGIRSSGSNELFENNTFVDVDMPIKFEAGVLGDPAKGAWYRTNQIALANNTVRNNNVVSMDAAHTTKREIYCTGVSSSIYIELVVEGGSVVDRQPTSQKALYGIHASHTRLTLRGYFGSGTTALCYLTGTGTIFARDCFFEPESGQTAHVFHLDAVTLGKKSVVLENVVRLTALDGGNHDFRTDGSTIDIDGIHVNKSPNFAGQTNNAVVSRDGWITGSATFDPASIAAGASTTTTVTVTGARLAVNDTVRVSTSISPANLIVYGQITASNVVTVSYFNPTAGAIDLASHTIFANVAKAPS